MKKLLISTSTVILLIRDVFSFGKKESFQMDNGE